MRSNFLYPNKNVNFLLRFSIIKQLCVTDMVDFLANPSDMNMVDGRRGYRLMMMMVVEKEKEYYCLVAFAEKLILLMFYSGKKITLYQAFEPRVQTNLTVPRI